MFKAKDWAPDRSAMPILTHPGNRAEETGEGGGGETHDSCTQTHVTTHAWVTCGNTSANATELAY